MMMMNHLYTNTSVLLRRKLVRMSL